MNTIIAQKGKFGDTEYFLSKMKASELINCVGFAEEMEEWEGMTADEKLQRELDYTRVITQIVPYIKEDPHRFFGSIIVDIYKGYEEIDFEPLTAITGNLPNAYKGLVGSVGFITFPGNERLIALDGQHRLASLRVAIKGKQGIPAKVQIKPNWEKYLVPCPDLGDEDVSVIFVRHESDEKIRRIFNKINKYAKQTSRSENIIISEDDTFALIARKLISVGPLQPLEEGELKQDIVNWKSNTLALRSAQLTTLSSIYTIAETLLKDEDINVNFTPDEEEIEEYYLINEEFWNNILSGIDVYRDYMNYILKKNVAASYRKNNLLYKPVTQMALAHVAYYANKHNIDFRKVVSLLNKIDWSMDNLLWQNILVIGSAKKKMITGKDAIRSAGLIITYLTMGDKMKQSEKDEVLQIIRNARDDEEASLPEVIKE